MHGDGNAVGGRGGVLGRELNLSGEKSSSTIS